MKREVPANANYNAAEQAFDRALELAGNQRYDLLEWKLRARIERVNEARLFLLLQQSF